MKRLAMYVLHCTMGISLALAIGTSASADWKPERPVRILVPFPAGGTADSMVRTVAAEVAKDAGQPIVVENKPGAAGKILYEYFKGVDGDGYTLGYVSSTGAVLTAISKKLDFDLVKDFKPILVLAEFSGLLATHPDVPANDFREFVAYAKKQPGKLSYASYGARGQDHLDFEQLLRVAEIDLVHVPFRGEAPTVTALLGNQVQLGRVIVSPKQYTDTGKLKVLAAFGKVRHPEFPEVKTLQEQGYNFSTQTWAGLAASPGTSDEAIAFWRKAFSAALQKPDVRARLTTLGFLPRGTGPEEVTKSLQEDIQSYRKAATAAGIELD